MPEVRVQLSDEQVEFMRGCADSALGPLAELQRAVRELPPPIKVGDRVRYRAVLPVQAHTATVLALDGDEAWVRWDEDGIRFTSLLPDLVRVEEGE